jgi:hypothetical protein
MYLTFSSLEEMVSTMEFEPAFRRLPEPVADALLAAVPDFIADAEVADQTHQYAYRSR